MKVSLLLIVKFLILMVLLNLSFSIINLAFAQQNRPFQFRWNIHEGVYPSGSFLVYGETISIDLGNEKQEFIADANEGTGFSYLYDNSGTSINSETYQVSISGGLNRLGFESYLNPGQAFHLEEVIQWGDVEWKSMEDMFHGAQVQFNLSQVDSPDLGQVTSMASMFKDAQFDENLGAWDIRTITNMSDIFSGSTLSQENYDATLIGWAEQEVQRNVIVGAEGLTYCGSKAARQKLIDEFGWAFVGDSLAETCGEGATNPLKMDWDVSEGALVNDYPARFEFVGSSMEVDWGDGEIENYSGSGWVSHQYGNLGRGFYSVSVNGDVEKIGLGIGEVGYSFFYGISAWGDLKLTSFEGMFKNLSRSIFITRTDVPDLSEITSLSELFEGTDLISNSGVPDWDVSHIQDMSRMFKNSRFDENLGNWDIGNVTDMTEIFSGSFLSQENYDATLIGWADQEVQRNVIVGAEGLTYCGSKAARQKLIEEYGWTFVGDAIAEACQDNDPDAFITTWEITSPGGQIMIPTQSPEYSYNYQVDWGDGSVQEGISESIYHTYTGSGEYQVTISGQFPKIWFYISPIEYKVKLKTVKQWGNMKWTDMYQAFYESGNLDITASDAPDLSQAFTTHSAFRSTGLTSPDLNHWDVSSIENFEEMFYRADLFNGKIDQWDMGNALNVAHMFDGADHFNQDISGWDMTSVNAISYLFAGADLFNQPIGNWNFENLQYLNNAFEDAASFDQSLANWNISKALSMEGIFDGSGMSQENYDATLIGWATQNVQRDVTVGAVGLVFCAGKAARQQLIDEFGWTFVGDTEATDCKEILTGITFEDAVFSYDGTQKTILVSGEIPDGVTVTYENNTLTEIGSQTATAYLDGGDLYENLILTATLTIVGGESPSAKASDIQLENPEVCSGETVLLEANSPTVTHPVFRFYRDEGLTQIIESEQVQVYEDTRIYVTVSGDGLNENLPGEAAVLEIKVNLIEAPVFLETIQEFCAEDTPTLHDFVLEPIAPGATLNYYPNLESTVALDGNTVLESKTYYAEVYDAVNGCGSARVPITAEVKTCNSEPGEKLPIEGITFEDATYSFDGTEKSITISGSLPTGVIVTYENNTRTEIGSQTATANLDGGESYEDLRLTAILTIVDEELPTATASDIEVTDLEVCLGEVIQLTASSLTVSNPVFTFYWDAQLTQPIEEDEIQILGTSQVFVTVKGNAIDENLPGEAAVWQISVLRVEAPVFSLASQEFCKEDQPTIAEIEVEGVGAGRILYYFSSEDATEPLPFSSLLVSQTYYAELVDEASTCRSERVSVLVEVADCQQTTAEFTLEKSADVPVVFPGEIIVYTILVKNNSDLPMDRLVVADNLEENLVFIEADNGGELDENKIVHWNLVNLEAGQTTTLKLTTQVKETAMANEVIRNQAHGINPDLPEQYQDSNVTETRVEENPGEPLPTTISVQKSQDHEGAIEPGTLVTYSILIRNTGESPALGLVVRDVISEGALVATSSENGQWVDNQVVWQIEKLEPGESIELQLELIIHLQSGTFSNSVFVGGENFEEASDQTTPLEMVPLEEENPVDLSIEFLGTLSTVLFPSEYAYEILVSNLGPNRANDVLVRHTLSEWVELIDVSPAKGSSTFDQEIGEILWELESLEPGESISGKIRLRAKGAGIVESYAEVSSGDFDPEILNNTLQITYSQIGLRIPNVFTPNGDGINETWELEGLLDVFSSNQLVVFDRMGKVVYSMENYQNDWGGSGLVRGTYFYELQGTDFQGEKHHYSGFVTLIY